MKKKHYHYLPKAYLRSFCDEEGRVRVYRKDDPGKCLHLSPDNVGFHRYYYSQPLPEGGRDHNTLENEFSRLEHNWPQIVERLQQRDDVNGSLVDILNFTALQRVRVPASRDACENAAAEMLMLVMRGVDARGELPPKPKGHEDIVDHVEFAIDPHHSIHGMKSMLYGIERVFDQIGIGVYHNMTDLPFLTSDNPVVWFDPSVPEAEMRPYVLQAGGPIVLLFPVAPNLMVYGHSSMRGQFLSYGLDHADLFDRDAVTMINRQICRFAYKTVFAQEPGQESLICEHADVSPILESFPLPTEEGESLFYQFAFGTRGRKPKWRD